MNVDRRTALFGIAGSGAAASIPSAARATFAPTILFADTRLPATGGFVAGAAGARVIDIATAEDDLWREVRDFVPAGSRVRGLTRWSDWITLRGVLLEKGLRVRDERAADPALTGDTALFHWEMA